MEVKCRSRSQTAGDQMLNMPAEIRHIVYLQDEPNFLDELAAAAIRPELTMKLFIRYEEVFADTCARWIELRERQNNVVIEAFARILPLAPHLSTFLHQYLEGPKSNNRTLRIQSLEADDIWLEECSTLELQRILLAVFRLLNFDKHVWSKTVPGAKIQEFLRHDDPGVRYLAARILCQILATSDLRLEAMIEHHVGKSEPVIGDFDGDILDLGFLSLFEQKRLRDAQRLQCRWENGTETRFNELSLDQLSHLVVRFSNTLLPRPNGQPTRASSLITTATTSRNMETFAKSLLSSSPILLHGLAGAGKTSLVNDFARELGVESNMVTLHLNEQTDAKMLIGMYTTGSKPGSFIWRAGVLTTAVIEGRWIFIEDLDRAPNDVISVILPLIQRGELFVPNRGEKIKAGQGFKLLASMRTTLNVTGQENSPALNMLGARLWSRVHVQMPCREEFTEIIERSHPILHKLLTIITNVYDRLYVLSHKPSFASKSRTSLGRPISPRDLLKWCRRLERVLVAAGSNTGAEPIRDSTKYQMFLEATDCFACSMQTEDSRKMIISAIAEEMHINPQQVEHFLTAHIPRFEDTDKYLTVGRVKLQKRPAPRVTKSVKKPRPFATTNHAKRLLEQVGVAVKMSEPVLLVGETGIGKTTVVQQLADLLGFKLTAVNLSQQSEVGDLLGGFKPVNIRSLAIPLKDEFDDLFASTGISATKNGKYVEQLGRSIAKSQWSKASRLWREAPKMFDQILSQLASKEPLNTTSKGEQPTKRRKTESRLQSLMQLRPRWQKFSQNLDQFDVQLTGGSKGFAFTFVEGNIVKAARNGHWVLLDEINLASPDTLESIADLLHSGPDNSPSILLSETGEIERIKAHPNFRIFGAMNPATDVGKRDLPTGLRSRFTEFYVESPDKNHDDLLSVIRAYLKGTSSNDERAANDVARLYIETKRLANVKALVDGANQVPHFSLRTLTRVLDFVTEISPSYGLRRALYEGFAMGFLTLLDRNSEKLLLPKIYEYLLESHGNPQALLAQTPKKLEDGRQYVRFVNKDKTRQYWMLQGFESPQTQPHYIITPFVERNMLNLVRATSTRRFPVLVQGPTSSGKTSMIEYLAKFSGNTFVRINNHEHTDLQEYLGAYLSGSDGQLRFQEGLLVQALRKGHWIVLDELNLAPTDVLEALNRLLDDNRELLIPETQEIVRPHENFMLFATQNPPGLYGGRKTLSRAFRNRFLELHFDDIPEDELDFILEHRSQKVAPSDCRRIVAVYKELSRLRQSNRLFEQKESFATLRDLFRWALRDADNREQLANNGYMLLAERVRNVEERLAVKEIIERVMKVKIDTDVLYDANMSPEIRSFNFTSNPQGVVWTQAMRRLYVLVAHALRNNEPVLLVGETGCGKTTVCQMIAEAFGKDLHIINAHQNTETGDLIGAQRPVRNRTVILEQLKKDLKQVMTIVNQNSDHSTDLDILLGIFKSLPSSSLDQIPIEIRHRIVKTQLKAKALFEWSDGSLLRAMREGQFFLLDEISLADDSVLERLNSVLEPQRTILLAEKGDETSNIVAAGGFQFFATMNPGGDYGKRELSPALRNRFTEIWVPSLSDHEDVYQIVQSKLEPELRQFSTAMVQFAEWFGQNYRSTSSTSISVRDILAWVKFMNDCECSSPYFAVLHGAAMVFIDTLGANPAALLTISPESILQEQSNCLQRLSTLLQHDVHPIYFTPIHIIDSTRQLTIGGFSIPKRVGLGSDDRGFAFEAPTTKHNAMRVVRALQVQKPILLEGSPGVGKTTLIAALARACNRPLTRINLSEQTDLMDLFGSDVPVEGAEAGHFAWRDAAYLQAMQKGEWVLLDEMNLASQSVLEGLNACLDHRGEVYISELDQTFKRHPNFTVFAAQNPHHQGGGRKGLPSSFVNRFTVVYADFLRNDDLAIICKRIFPSIADEVVLTIIKFVSQLEHEIVHKRRFGSQGGPWELNLRDILRWLQLLTSEAPFLSAANPSHFLNLVFKQRFRTLKDRQEVDKIFSEVFGYDIPFRHFFHNLGASAYQVGLAYMSRDSLLRRISFPSVEPIDYLAEIESVMICIQQSLPCILVGASGCGKSTILQHVAATSGKSLVILPLNADIDTMDLVGGFEQMDPQRAASSFLEELREVIASRVIRSLPAKVPSEALFLLETLQMDHPISQAYLMTLAQSLDSLSATFPHPELYTLAKACRNHAQRPLIVENARFEWVDGVLIKALEQGDWLVLDDANLCSASVLDRLNSLLEPDGFLNINEHCDPGGEPKVIRPHPEFRVFLTMDPKFGELSRAMRNRAVEIFIESPSAINRARQESTSARLEASMHRFQSIEIVLGSESSNSQNQHLLQAVAIENLSWSDIPLLRRFFSSWASLMPPANVAGFEELIHAYIDIYQSPSNRTLRIGVGENLGSLVSESGESLPADFCDAQIFHPLQNSPLVTALLQSSKNEDTFRLATIFDILLELSEAMAAFKSQNMSLDSLKPNKMNRLQRSLVRKRAPAISMDSTVNVSVFLENVLKCLGDFVRGNSSLDGAWKQQKKLHSVMQYWWHTYHLSTSPAFDESTFQAHLSIGADLFDKSNENPVFSEFSNGLKRDFDTGFKLNSGLSMEIMWKHFRPIVVASLPSMRVLEHMEQQAQRFDVLRWKAAISVTELSGIMIGLVKAYHLVLTSDVDGAALVETLSEELWRLENNMSHEEEGISPFFALQFESMRQYSTMTLMCSESWNESAVVNPDVIILSDYPTTSEMRLSNSTSSSRGLHMADSLWREGFGIQPLINSFSTGLLRKFDRLREVDLKSLKLLETELPMLGEILTKSSALMGENQLRILDQILLSLILSIVALHDLPFSRSYSELAREFLNTAEAEEFKQRAPGPRQEGHLSLFAQVLGSHFNHAITSLGASKLTSIQDPAKALQHSSKAWILFAVGMIILYVPDKAFDPDKRVRLERDRHINLRDTLEQKLSALERFESLFSGQRSNLRCEIMKTDIAELGEPPKILQEIYRPDVSELDQLQGEFSTLLKTISSSKVLLNVENIFVNDADSSLAEIQLLQRNLQQLVKRLSERFRAYHDLSAPVVNMLRCLQIGLWMATIAYESETTDSETSQSLSQMTPFLGGGRYTPSFDGVLESYPLEYLSLVSTKVSVEGLSSFCHDSRYSLLKAFHACYDQWSKKLDIDRAEADSKSGLYHFKGSADDEENFDEREFTKLFPTYDQDSADVSDPATPSSYVRDTAVSIAQLHSNIFISGDSPSQCIESLIRTISKKIGLLENSVSHSGNHQMASALLPGILLHLDDHIIALNTTFSLPDSYNFYSDPNLPESRKLVSLIHSIQNRFHHLQSVDEIAHMQPLSDVLTSCRDLLAFSHTEPLAKIITKVEKVHNFVHEWQFGGWASKANSTLTQYDELTKTIVDWRRLELGTWKNLFNMEVVKCEDDAKSWWFVAYQVVIAVPLQISDSPDQLSDYTKKLLKDLETYFSTAILGQFVQRLRLLRQLKVHLSLIVKDHMSMAFLHDALSNFVSFYERFERLVNETLTKERTLLEKAMKDVILLASWKDTNIVALRDSAKRSHHKLFKIVRKFRAVLGRSMDLIIKQGLPEENNFDVQQSAYSLLAQVPPVDPAALAICGESVPNWSSKSKRLVNVSKTVKMMADASQNADSFVDGSAYLESFLNNLITSTADLRKATPTILNEDTKITVKHLKSRKRKLFADTLKDLRQMGIKFNLSVDSLAKQDSLSMVLADTAGVAKIEDLSIEYYFHKYIDIIKRARDAAVQHSEDLSAAEVTRSIGFLEGLLQAILTQRKVFTSLIVSITNFEARMTMTQNLWMPNAHDIKRSRIATSISDFLRWLPNILTVALNLIKVHDNISKFDSQSASDSLSAWAETFSTYMRRWDSLCDLPLGVSSTTRQILERTVIDSAQQFRIDLSGMSESYPNLAFIFNQIIPWAEVQTSTIENGATAATINDLDAKLSAICDSVLVAIEKYKDVSNNQPSSTDDASWLLKSDTCFANSIKALHCEEITKQLDQAFEMLIGTDFDKIETARAASALFAVALPILQQYLVILQEKMVRYGQLHRAICKSSYILAKTFIQIATQGFCTPAEKPEAQHGETEKLEDGTGLGDGEGAEDISKDIQEDEDLDELAQEPNTTEKNEFEDEQDAVDMADGEMEGEMGENKDQSESEDGSDHDDNEANMDEEAGDVDDLDPTAVDEKMWDGGDEQAEKDQEDDDGKGKASKDEQVAAQENNETTETASDGEEEEEMAGAEQGEDIVQNEAEKHDSHAEDGEALDLPDDMELDNKENEGSECGTDDAMNDLSDLEDDGKMEEEEKGKEADGADNIDDSQDQHPGDEMDVVDIAEELQDGEEKTKDAGETEEGPSEEQSESQESLLQDRNDKVDADAENAVPSDAQGVGEDQDAKATYDKTESASKTQREEGGIGGDASEKLDDSAEDGDVGHKADGDAPQDPRHETEDASPAQPFKKLGDALESWHRQQTQIQEPQDKTPRDQAQDISSDIDEFQHLQDDEAEGDTQAMGTATEDQAHALDESMAIDSESKDMPDQFQPDEINNDKVDHEDVVDMEKEPSTPKDQELTEHYENKTGAMIQQAQENYDEEMDDLQYQPPPESEDVDEVDTQLESTHLDSSSIDLRSAADARLKWTHYEGITRDLSLSLTEQLRLILAPTLATKMRGDFRSGKRLNIKRIIPYIASQYKRDKIWMRRSVPSKRSYQIILAVDDSKSMGESGSGSLAFETLAMVSKSLSMLEVGEICVVGFGENVKVAHDFETPFSSDAGPKVFQNFGFNQSRTDVTKLVRESIELFRAARAKASGTAADLWQMQLIISDGVCDSSEHEPIRRLLREALEERIMIVFVIVDDLKHKKKGESVMDLKEAKFVKDGVSGVSNVKIERYLDTFPFQYYLIVSDVKELPGVLATLLRQWFTEVVDSTN